MTAYDWAVVIAVGALLVLASSYQPRRDRAAWQASTTTRRTEDDVRRDLAAARKALEIAQLYEIWPDPPRGTTQLPNQRQHRTEDPQ
ncbi:hypothetical protein [Streptomyces sp. NRRL F-2664]|uniref:hypothetical protein n=1 Tax=Streptomyces sp. NRRL F-2664 TaxID=1463842 RepID=UPI0004C8F7CD|nr:hypothetical protein [Streptomyces sp. NRRL F-2664]